jgi:hypothetical protein
VLLGEAQRGAWHIGAARQTLVEAATLALSLGDPDALDRAVTSLAWVHELSDAEPAVLEVVDQAVRLPGLPPARRARYLAARVQLGGLPPDEELRLLDEAEELARSTPDELSLGLVLAAGCLTRGGPDDLAWRREAADEIRPIGERTASDVLTVHSHRLLASTLLEAGDHGRARVELERFIERAAASGRPAFDALVAQVENGRDLMQGRFAAVEARLPRVRLGVEESLAYLAAWALQVICLRRAQGRSAEVLPAMRAGVADHGNPGMRVAVAAMALEAGDLLGAAELDHVVAEGLDVFPRDDTWMATMSDLAMGAWLADRRDLAKDVYTRLVPYADRLVVLAHGVLCFGSAHRFVGLAAVTAGHYEIGIEHLRAGLPVDEELDAGLALARGHLALGRALSPSTPGPVQADEAGRHLREASRRASLLGMAGVQAAAEQELDDLDR